APDPFFPSHRDQLATLAVQLGVPARYNLREFAKAGGLMSYGTIVTEASRQAGLFARLGSAHETGLRHRSASLTPAAPSSPAAAGCAARSKRRAYIHDSCVRRRRRRRAHRALGCPSRP